MAHATTRNVLSGVLLLFLTCTWLPLLDGRFAPLTPELVRASPDQETLRPNADGHTVQFTVSDTTHYGATSDNSDTTYVWSNTAGQYEFLDVDDTSGSGTINWVQVTYRCYASGSGAPEKFDFYIYSDTTETKTDNKVVITRNSWNNYTGTQQSTNPATGSAWQWSEVDAMEAGLYAESVGGTEELRCSEIWVVVDYTTGETDPPQFPAYTGTTNNSEVACWTAFLGNWSITDANPDTYEIFSNYTGTNESKTSGTYVSGDYKWWTCLNENTSNVGKRVFIQIYANDTGGYTNSSIAFFNVTSYFELDIIETTFNWTAPNVIKGSGVWVYIDQPSKQFLNLSIKAAPAWEVRGYINDSSAELHIKVQGTDSTGEGMPQSESWWDGNGLELTTSEQVIPGLDNEPAGDYTISSNHYGFWMVCQVDDGGGSYYGILLTLLIYQDV